MQHIQIRELTSIEEFQNMQKVEENVWDMPPIPLHQTYTAVNNGGIILGAFDHGEMIGFLYSFAGFNGETPYLCSHMLGIKRKYRRFGIGVQMKFKQAELAKNKGYAMITWTYDPLESLNAYVNLHKLGGEGVTYKVNHYGSLNDQLNAGLPTDRIVIEWDLLKEKALSSDNVTVEEDKQLIMSDSEGRPVITEKFKSDLKSSDVWFLSIPSQFQKIKQENMKLAKEWRAKTQKVFTTLFTQDFCAKNFLYDKLTKQGTYVFRRK